jgi:chromosome segregation ATPase
MALSNEFILSELIKSGSAALRQPTAQDGTLVVNTSVTTDGSAFGYVERPVYNNEQLVKAVDTIVDELIATPRQAGPAVVLKSVHDDLRKELNTALENIKQLQKQVNDLTTENKNLQNRIDQLLIDIDLQKLLKSSADNEKEALAQSLQSVTVDLQAALIKGTKEAVERVSREASLQGILAQKEAFTKIQDDARKSIEEANKTIVGLTSDITTLQSNYTKAVADFVTAK